jgi:hypothetical protein
MNKSNILKTMLFSLILGVSGHITAAAHPVLDEGDEPEIVVPGVDSAKKVPVYHQNIFGIKPESVDTFMAFLRAPARDGGFQLVDFPKIDDLPKEVQDIIFAYFKDYYGWGFEPVSIPVGTKRIPDLAEMGFSEDGAVYLKSLTTDLSLSKYYCCSANTGWDPKYVKKVTPKILDAFKKYELNPETGIRLKTVGGKQIFLKDHAKDTVIRELRLPKAAGKHYICNAYYSPKGTYAAIMVHHETPFQEAVTPEHHTIHIFDTKTWKCIRTMENIATIDISGDETYMAYATSDAGPRLMQGRVFLRNLKTDWSTEIEFDTEQVMVKALAFSPDGRWLAVGTIDGALIVCDVVSGKKVYETQYHGIIQTIRFSADNTKIAILVGEDGIDDQLYMLSTDDSTSWQEVLVKCAYKNVKNEKGYQALLASKAFASLSPEKQELFKKRYALSTSTLLAPELGLIEWEPTGNEEEQEEEQADEFPDGVPAAMPQDDDGWENPAGFAQLPPAGHIIVQGAIMNIEDAVEFLAQQEAEEGDAEGDQQEPNDLPDEI